MPVKSHDPPQFATPHPLYSSYTTVPLSATSSLVSVAGQVAEDPETGDTPTDLASQVDLCLTRMGACLDHAGAKKNDIIRFMYYITQHGIDQFEEAEGKGSAVRLIGNKVGQWLEGHRPASSYLRVFGMSDEKYLCEFECMAVVKNDG